MLITLIALIPFFIVWVSAIIVAVMLVKRGAGTPSTYFLVGSTLMLIGTLVGGVVSIYLTLRSETMTMAAVASAIGLSTNVKHLIELAGIIVLIIGFWKSNTRR